MDMYTTSIEKFTARLRLLGYVEARLQLSLFFSIFTQFENYF